TYTVRNSGRLSSVGHSQFANRAASLPAKKNIGPNNQTSHTSQTHGAMRPNGPRVSCRAMHRMESGAALDFNCHLTDSWYALWRRLPMSCRLYHTWGMNRLVRS